MKLIPKTSIVKDNMQSTSRFILLGVLIWLSKLLSGCGGYEVMSHEVQAGGTVLIAVGGSSGIDEGPDVGNYSAYMVVEGGTAQSNPKQLTVRSVFRVLPEPTSNHGISFHAESYRDDLTQYESQLFAVVDLMIPGDPEIPSLLEGAGEIEITDAKLNRVTSHVVTIIPGEGTINPMQVNNPVYGPQGSHYWNRAMPNPNVQISTGLGTFDPATATITGASFTVTYNEADFVEETPVLYPLHVVKTHNDHNLQLAWNHEPIGNGQVQLTINLSNPHGFYTNAEGWAPMKRSTLERGLSAAAIVWLDQHYLGASANPFDGTLQATYFDENGDEVIGFSPVLIRRN